MDAPLPHFTIDYSLSSYSRPPIKSASTSSFGSLTQSLSSNNIDQPTDSRLASHATLTPPALTRSTSSSSDSSAASYASLSDSVISARPSIALRKSSSSLRSSETCEDQTVEEIVAIKPARPILTLTMPVASGLPGPTIPVQIFDSPELLADDLSRPRRSAKGQRRISKWSPDSLPSPGSASSGLLSPEIRRSVRPPSPKTSTSPKSYASSPTSSDSTHSLDAEFLSDARAAANPTTEETSGRPLSTLSSGSFVSAQSDVSHSGLSSSVPHELEHAFDSPATVRAPTSFRRSESAPQVSLKQIEARPAPLQLQSTPFVVTEESPIEPPSPTVTVRQPKSILKAKSLGNLRAKPAKALPKIPLHQPSHVEITPRTSKWTLRSKPSTAFSLSSARSTSPKHDSESIASLALQTSSPLPEPRTAPLPTHIRRTPSPPHSQSIADALPSPVVQDQAVESLARVHDPYATERPLDRANRMSVMPDMTALGTDERPAPGSFPSFYAALPGPSTSPPVSPSSSERRPFALPSLGSRRSIAAKQSLPNLSSFTDRTSQMSSGRAKPLPDKFALPNVLDLTDPWGASFNNVSAFDAAIVYAPDPMAMHYRASALYSNSNPAAATRSSVHHGSPSSLPASLSSQGSRPFRASGLTQSSASLSTASDGGQRSRPGVIRRDSSPLANSATLPPGARRTAPPPPRPITLFIDGEDEDASASVKSSTMKQKFRRTLLSRKPPRDLQAAQEQSVSVDSDLSTTIAATSFSPSISSTAIASTNSIDAASTRSTPKTLGKLAPRRFRLFSQRQPKEVPVSTSQSAAVQS
ncbi:uncharacterized protein L969DRAFT_21083 [Mixia osmundae IAM 14324]|uniref:Uncharacterized protein n=1 Tax=Mixia osmundae (strain CBS 9802 / IAM 14324 / JCM 22182 / KY 12970) TaxID=764103 RepID=G7E027_MIXOS|nr:uncharacterized protein L969DRAFT_21083 [Mixia osmundae IAM 14324]KEI42180.1 hypothetical protein L969DRAFT_21083 [Mixia osmundae IAM 14324]GAA96187.1 hypothetical protein E5Q_02851 [Mixia osmundae IAM 14324]